MKSCITCSMPFEGNHANDVGMETEWGPVCKFDSENGQMKSPEQIFAGGIHFFMLQAAPGDRNLAERLTRSNMKRLPYWQEHHFVMLEGEEATREEFASALTKIGE